MTKLFKKKPKEGMVTKNSTIGMVVDIIIIILLLFFMFICIMPMWHTLVASLSDGKTLLGAKGLLWVPVGKINFDGYDLLFSNKYQIPRSFLNTIIYVVSSSLLGMVINVVGGYVLSRQSKLRSFMIMFIMLPMMFNGGMIPTYLVIKTLGMVETPLALIIPNCTNAMFIVLCMNSFLQVPQSTIEAAELDGAGHLRVMFKIALPQGLGLILVTLINSVIIGWNSWFTALIYVPASKDLWPLQLWIKEVVAQSQTFMQKPNPNYVENTLQYVVIIVSTLPLFITFPFFIKKLEQGMVLGAVKE